jgi:Ribbon-helix-helix protein, copG family.
MPKEKISVTLDAEVVAAAAERAQALHMNRSEYLEDLIRRDAEASLWADYRDRTVPALDIDAYASEVYAQMTKAHRKAPRAHG